MEPITNTMAHRERLWKKLKQGVFILLLVSFFFNAFPHVNSIKDGTFFLAVLGFLVLVIKKKIRADLFSPMSLPLLMLFIWAFFTSVTADEISDSFDSLLSHFIKYLILLIVTASILDNHSNIRWLIRSFTTSTLLFCIGAVVYFYGLQSNLWSARLGFDAAAHNIICFGANLAVIFAIHEFRSTNQSDLKPLILSAILALITTTFLTQSRGGILALATSVICLFLFDKKIKILVPVLLIIGVGLMVSPIKDRFLEKQSLSNHHRLGAISYYYEVFKDHPVKGLGFAIDIFDNEKVYASDTYFNRIPEAYRQGIFTVLPHSMLLNIVVRMGLVGLYLYIYLLAVYFSMGIQVSVHAESKQSRALARTLVAGMVMFLVGGLFESVFIHHLDTIFFSLLAMNIVLWKLSFPNVRCQGLVVWPSTCLHRS